MPMTEQYYALCVQEEDGSTEIAFFELTREALPGALGISLYTSPDGELQRRHLQDRCTPTLREQGRAMWIRRRSREHGLGRK